MKLKILQTFKFAHRGCDVVEYQADTEVETEDPELVEISVREGWAESDDGTAKGGKAKKA